jgi:hypothetical protein
MAPAVPRNSMRLLGRIPRPAMVALVAGVAIGAALSSVVLPRDAGAGRRLNVVNKATKVANVVSARAGQAQAAANSETAPATQAKPASSTPGVKPVATSNTKPASAGQKMVARSAQNATGVLRVSPPSAPQEERVTYHYNALGRRDPFTPLVGGGFVGMDVGGAAPPDVGGIKVVGIVWGASDRFALVEDPRGNSLVLRKGDKVMNGVVESLKRDALVVKLDMEGISQSVTIPVTRKGEKNDDNN